jgi:PAS domain S-box-containing protein
MLNIRGSVSKKLTALNLLVSGTAVLLACASFLAYDINNFRHTILEELSVQAEIIGSNSVSPLVFNDPPSAAKTLAALHASPNIIYAGIYTPDGQFFAGYWRNPQDENHAPPLIAAEDIRNRWTGEREFAVVRSIVFDGKMIGTVYIRSDVQALIDRLKDYLIILAGILILSLVAALFVSRIPQQVISMPITELAETARMVSRDKNYGVRANPSGGSDEIALLIDAFNGMLTEIQKRDTALLESEEQFRTLANSVPQLAWMAEPDGYIFWYNRRWYEYTGTTPEQTKGWNWQSLHDPNVLPEVLEKWRASLETGRPFEMVFPLRGADGSLRDFLTIVVPVHDAQGRVVRWFGTNTDITEQRRSEEALRRSEKLAATGRLAASIAHEINNPLEAVSNLLYLARKQPAKAETYLKIADEEVDRIAQITKHTLGFYRDSSTPVGLEISDILHGVLGLYNGKLKFKKVVVIERYRKPAEIIGYAGELRQVFANLVINAIEALGEGGTLVIKASKGRDWKIGGAAGVRVSLMDNGAGIDRAKISRIFDPFYTTKGDVGTGLGLWLTQNLVRKHGGSIKVRSRTDAGRKGTIFSIFLPEKASKDESKS